MTASIWTRAELDAMPAPLRMLREYNAAHASEAITACDVITCGRQRETCRNCGQTVAYVPEHQRGGGCHDDD